MQSEESTSAVPPAKEQATAPESAAAPDVPAKPPPAPECPSPDTSVPAYLEPDAEATDLQDIIDRLTGEIDRLKASEAELRETALRARAEMENVQKRTRRDSVNAHKYALERFVRELAPVLDCLDLAIQHASSESESSGQLREGLEMTVRLFDELLQRFDVEIIDPTGCPFDSARHEAVAVQDDEVGARCKVITVVQKGYALHDRLIRPARVIVAQD